MTYEDAPATKMLRVGCACCGRALLDAESVESGMGPVCREKNLVFTPDRDPDWTTPQPPELSPKALAAWAAGDARVTVNAIVRMISVDRQAPHVGLYVECVEALGYTRLGRVLRDGNRAAIRALEQDRARVEKARLVAIARLEKQRQAENEHRQMQAAEADRRLRAAEYQRLIADRQRAIEEAKADIARRKAERKAEQEAEAKEQWERMMALSGAKKAGNP